MLTAKWNDGVVFVTTLLLSATKQTQLIQAMLLTHGKVSSLPEPGALRRVAYRYAVKAAAGVLSGLLVLLLAPSDTNVVIPVAVATAVTALLDAMPSISRGAARLVRSFTGA